MDARCHAIVILAEGFMRSIERLAGAWTAATAVAGGARHEAAAGVACVSMHHDISTVTGEEVFVFRLAESPAVRIVRTK
jgi:hypothetical protein